MDSIIVTVKCMTYNHARYIRKCLEGFVRQKTNFRFEVIVHDDASTDGTADIIREYEQKYPDIIRPIYQTVNQYSQHVLMTQKFIYPLARGKYIAFCEGDDYWCDENKLQKQVDAMEANPDCHICVHRVQGINEDGTYDDTYRTYPMKETAIKEGIISPEQLIDNSNIPYNFQTSSYFLRADDFWEYVNNPPEFRNACGNGIGDIPLVLYFASLGNGYFIDSIMSHYRQMSPGGWTAKMKNSSLDKRLGRWYGRLAMFEAYDLFTHERFHEIIENEKKKIYPKINQLAFKQCAENGDFLACISSKFKDIRHRESLSCQVSMYLRALLQLSGLHRIKDKNNAT